MTCRAAHGSARSRQLGLTDEPTLPRPRGRGGSRAACEEIATQLEGLARSPGFSSRSERSIPIEELIERVSVDPFGESSHPDVRIGLSERRSAVDRAVDELVDALGRMGKAVRQDST